MRWRDSRQHAPGERATTIDNALETRDEIVVKDYEARDINISGVKKRLDSRLLRVPDLHGLLRLAYGLLWLQHVMYQLLNTQYYHAALLRYFSSYVHRDRA